MCYLHNAQSTRENAALSVNCTDFVFLAAMSTEMAFLRSKSRSTSPHGLFYHLFNVNYSLNCNFGKLKNYPDCVFLLFI